MRPQTDPRKTVADIPRESRFKLVGEAKPTLDFIDAPDIESIANALIGRYKTTLGHLAEARVTYLWKRSGGDRNGHDVLGKCVKPSGLVKYFGHTDFVVWLGADNCASQMLTLYQLEALIFHELLHAWIDPVTSKTAILPHDLEAFRAEVETYGLWDQSLAEMSASMKIADQLPLGLEYQISPGEEDKAS